MKLAVTYENGQIFPHFGHTQQFKIYDVSEAGVGGAMVVSAHGAGHGALVGFLRALGVNALVCGGIGGGALEALALAGITVYPGVSGDADQAVAQLAQGTLVYDPNAQCTHHQEAEGHDCAGHTCGGGGEGCPGSQWNLPH